MEHFNYEHFDNGECFRLNGRIQQIHLRPQLEAHHGIEGADCEKHRIRTEGYDTEQMRWWVPRLRVVGDKC